ncbi:hypothetical protein [Zoogloea sp.]|uniref:hypothetical protein n=1 Tax=Zoogloea sp. TaxID=49181 RepID=UPI0026093573|nr:hypothetical protein [Zoogloea sp.]MDD3353290.1 hypothetical protein [Zoogloea sp.]
MSSEASLTLGDFVTLVRGTTYKGNLVGKPGPALLGLGSIEPGGGFRDTDFKTYGGECPEKLMLSPGDLFAALKGATKDGKMIGSVARVPPFVQSGRLTQDTVKLKFCRQDNETVSYVYWLLRTPQYRDYCAGRATGSAVVALSREDFLAYPVPAQTSLRARVVELLEEIEIRIALLRDTNATLESIAQALFKSWFVDFDPVRTKQQGLAPEGMDEETAALFPDEFEESELGLVPKGWRIGAVDSFAERVGMGPFGSNIKVSTFVEHGVPIISGQHLKKLLVEDNSFNYITEDHAEKLAKSCVRAGDVIFTHAGSIGQVSLLHAAARFGEYVLSQRQFFLRCDLSEMRPEWVTYYFRSPQGQHQLLANMSQVGVPSIARPVTYLRSIRLLIPPLPIIDRFSSIADSVHQRLMLSRQHIKTLTTLRDTLLPRLISGQLRLPEAESLLEEAPA